MNVKPSLTEKRKFNYIVLGLVLLAIIAGIADRLL